MKRLIAIIALFVCTSVQSDVIDNGRVRIETSPYVAWNIYSLKVDGYEYITCKDDGMCVQSSYRPKGWGELNNPTQSGSSTRNGGLNPGPSNSVNLFKAKTNNILFTNTRMAYFEPYNKKLLSDFVLSQWTNLDAFGQWNIIRFKMKLHIPASEPHYKVGVWESLTAYMPAGKFTKFWIVKGGKLVALPKRPGEQKYPVVISTADGKHAFGVYSATNHNYGRRSFFFAKVVKWNAIRRINNPQGNYNAEIFGVVGSLSKVLDSIQLLINYHNAFEGSK